MALGCAGAALVAAGCGLTSSSTKITTVTRTVTHTVTTTRTVTTSAQGNACTAHDLTATFQVLQGSAGAGNIVYTLRATNASQAACTLSGFPTVDFVDANGKVFPSHLNDSGTKGAVVAVAPGASASSQVRFSPDVTPCESGTATTLRLTLPDSSTLHAKIDPATHLCGGGSLQPTSWTGAD